tara:strand:- start:6963 stop:7853 length:891 start_codon:yes stop_codon:yes gene_type:complete
MENRVIITGATGFVGSNLARKFVQKGFEVYLIVREGSSYHNIQDIVSDVIIYTYTGDVKGIYQFLLNSKSDTIYHIASCFVAEHKSEDIDRLVDSNLLFGLKVAEAAQLAGIRYFVNTGTSWQHFNNSLYNPVCLYAATKEAFEKLLDYYAESLTFNVISLHLFDTYGETDKRPKLINMLSQFSREGRVLDLSPGEQLLDLVHIDDVISAYLIAGKLLRERKVSGHKIYGVSSGNSISLRSLIMLFEEVSGSKVKVNWGAREYRKREVMEPWTNFDQLPGWEPKINIREGLERIQQ